MAKENLKPEQIKNIQAEDGDTVTTNEAVFFWKPPSWGNQWTECHFVVETIISIQKIRINANDVHTFENVEYIKYNCGEQYMMASKARLFDDKETLKKIMDSTDPREHKALGRKVKGFDEKIWNEKCMPIVIEGNMAKFSQNLSFKQKLLGTGNKQLVEASKIDRIWGIGFSPKEAPFSDKTKWGKNLLGKCLMKVRENLVNQEK